MSDDIDTTFDDNQQEQPAAEAQAPAKEAPKAEAPAPAAEPKKEEASASDFNFDMSDLQGPGVEVLQIGQHVSRLPVERMKFSTTAPSLISIVIPNPIAVKTHYREGADGKGTSYLCLGAGQPCCEKDGLPRVRYVFPIVVYDVNSDFKLLSKKVQFRALVLGEEGYKALCSMARLNGPLNQMDIAVQCSDERYQKCTYTFAGACRYAKSQSVKKEVFEFWKQNMKHLVTPVAQKKDLNWVLEKQAPANDAPTAVETAGQVDFNDVFKD